MKTKRGVEDAYYSPRKPTIRFAGVPGEWLVAFSEHALKRICERTVYNWKDFGGQGDAFAVQDKLSAAAKDTAFRLAIDESGGTRYGLLTTRGHFFFGVVCVPPRTRMATTV